jgi:hypothetical protein
MHELKLYLFNMVAIIAVVAKRVNAPLLLLDSLSLDGTIALETGEIVEVTSLSALERKDAIVLL